MTPEEIREYTLAKPGAYPDEPWEGDLVAKVVAAPELHLGSSLGVNKPGSDGDKPYLM